MISKLSERVQTRKLPELQYDTSDLLDWLIKKHHVARDREHAVDHIDWSDVVQLQYLKKNVCESKPGLDPKSEFLVVNVLNYGNPGYDAELRGHRGIHPAT